MKLLWGSLGVFLGSGILCLMPCLLLYYLGYEARTDWNKSAVETTCNIISHKIQDRECSYSCNCHQTCTSSTTSSHCTTTCHTCYYTCYDGFIEVKYYIQDSDENNKEYDKMIEVYNGYEYYDELYNKMTKNYPVGSQITCYYNSLKPDEVKLKLYEPTVYLAFSIIFAILGGIIVLGWIGFIILSFRKDFFFH